MGIYVRISPVYEASSACHALGSVGLGDAIVLLTQILNPCRVENTKVSVRNLKDESFTVFSKASTGFRHSKLDREGTGRPDDHDWWSHEFSTCVNGELEFNNFRLVLETYARAWRSEVPPQVYRDILPQLKLPPVTSAWIKAHT